MREQKTQTTTPAGLVTVVDMTIRVPCDGLLHSCANVGFPLPFSYRSATWEALVALSCLVVIDVTGQRRNRARRGYRGWSEALESKARDGAGSGVDHANVLVVYCTESRALVTCGRGYAVRASGDRGMPEERVR